MTTVRKLSKSAPRPLSLVLGRTCRNVHVVSLPRLRVAHLRRPLSSPPFRRSAGGYAPSLWQPATGGLALLRRSGFLW